MREGGRGEGELTTGPCMRYYIEVRGVTSHLVAAGGVDNPLTTLLRL